MKNHQPDNRSEHQPVTIGMLAHVDAGKTTLSESLLYAAGRIRQRGRVDHGDAFLDNYALEKKRGITIFSKQAELQIHGRPFTLLDTPGHVDFSAEMERTMQVLDAAVLLISAADGVTGQVRILWKLLGHYRVPVFLFVNKMDQPGADAGKILAQLREELSPHCVDISGGWSGDGDGSGTDRSGVALTETALEDLVVADEGLMERYLAGDLPDDADIRRLVCGRQVFPCIFGSALRQQGISALTEALARFAPETEWPGAFSARCFKISSDPQGKRLAWLKITGGVLHVRDALVIPGSGASEKVSQIRICEGDSYEAVPEVCAGRVCAVTGLAGIQAGDGLGEMNDDLKPQIRPYSSVRIIPDEEADPANVLSCLRILEQEEPMLHIASDPDTGEITAQIMGQVQLEILRELMRERFGMRVSFGPARILYRETIAEPVEGVGHYEPLRHYAEVHLLLEPTGPGSGLSFAADCSTDVLKLNWQRLILTHLQEKTFRGVLTGSEITDMRITVIGGRAHEKHTEGGDFREATYRAVRQGLMTAHSVLLEPWLSLRAEIPAESVGRILGDVQRMGGTAAITESGTRTVVEGSVPASSAADYPAEFTAAAHGAGHLELTFSGYAPCRDPEPVIAEAAYDPDADTDQPSWSVFCSHGAGTPVSWDRVREYMHVDTGWSFSGTDTDGGRDREDGAAFGKGRQDTWKEREKRFGAEEEELRRIFERTYGSVVPWRREPGLSAEEGPWDPAVKAKNEDQETFRRHGRTQKNKKPPCLLVDGYNVIYASEELKELALTGLDAARDRLLEMLADYHGMRTGDLIVVFDAYRVPGGTEHCGRYKNLHTVFTKEAETADAYIEKTVHRLAGSMDVTVATSDGLEQMIILGSGARRMSARELLEDMKNSREGVRREYLDSGKRARAGVLEGISAEVAGALRNVTDQDERAGTEKTARKKDKTETRG